MRDVCVFLLPGWRHAGPEHWLSRWALLHAFQRVEQDDWQWPRRGDWMARLEDTLLDADRPALLVADGLGCQLVAAWAAHSRHTHRVAGALLVAPADLGRADLPPQLQTWAPLRRQGLPQGPPLPLPFPHTDVPAADGSGDWPAGIGLLQALAMRAGLAGAGSALAAMAAGAA